MAEDEARATDATACAQHHGRPDEVAAPAVEVTELDRELVLPLYEEDIDVTKRVVETGRVEVRRVTRIEERPIDETVKLEKVEVERVPIDLPVDAVPEIRQEGDITIIPVVAEEIVVTRRLVLKEEVRVRRVSEQDSVHEVVTLRSQEAIVSRSTPDEPRVTPDK